MERKNGRPQWPMFRFHDSIVTIVIEAVLRSSLRRLGGRPLLHTHQAPDPPKFHLGEWTVIEPHHSSNTSPGPPASTHHHPMSTPGDLCGKSGTDYRCSGPCDYDLCKECWDRSWGAPFRCTGLDRLPFVRFGPNGALNTF